MNLYHGTSELFEEFEFDYIGSANGTAEGFGFYLSDSKEIAKNYAKKYLLEIEFEPGNELKSSEKMNIDDFKKFVTELNERCEFFSNYGDIEYSGYNNVLNELIELEYEGNDENGDLIGSIINSCGSTKDVNETLYDLFNITHMAVNADWGHNVDEHIVYLVLIPSKMKIQKIIEMV